MVDKTQVQENGQMLEFLQQAVNAETTSRNLYWSRSVFWRNLGLSKLAEYYLTQSSEDHAQRSADRMAQLGQHPSVNPSQVSPFEDQPVDEQLRVDLAVEVELANSYREWIDQAESVSDYVTRQIWCEVLRSTEEHVDLLQGWLAQIKLVGSETWLATWRSKDDRGM